MNKFESKIISRLISINPKSNEYCGNATTNKTFPCFLRWQLDQWGSPKKESKHVSHDVVAHYHADWDNEPVKTIFY